MSDSVTALPPLGAALDNVTVHIVLLPDVTVAGEHCSPETTGAVDAVEVITLPAPETARKVPSDAAPITLVTGSEIELRLVGLSVTATTATTPLAIVLLLTPLATQMIDPLAERQVSDFLAAVSAEPAVALRETMSLVG